MRVCIDPGHGYKKTRPTGAQANGLIEDDWALLMAQRLGHYLRSRSIETVITRESEYVPINHRTALAKKTDCDLFISVHFNAGPASAQGTEIFAAARDWKSLSVAEGLLQPICAHGMRKRGAKWDFQSAHSRLGVLRGTYRKMPAVLIEFGFATNRHDAGLLADKRWVEDVACTLAEKIENLKL